MAVRVLTDWKVLAGGYDISGDHNEARLEYGAELKDVSTPKSSKDRSFLAGLKTIACSGQGLWQADAEVANAPKKIDDILQANLGAADIPITLAEVATEGEAALSFLSLLRAYRFLGPHGEPHPFSWDAVGRGKPAMRGTLLNVSNRTVTFNGTAFNLGAISATQRLYLAVHVVAFGGVTPTLDLVLESDDAQGFATPTTRITLSQKTGFASDWQELAGAITDTWWRIKGTIGGTGGPNFTIFAVAGIQ